MQGPGKYDELCTLVREQAKALGAIVMIINGQHGSGFSCQADAVIAAHLPDLLESVAAEMRQDIQKEKDHAARKDAAVPELLPGTGTGPDL
jgi:hypothetical protein